MRLFKKYTIEIGISAVVALLFVLSMQFLSSHQSEERKAVFYPEPVEMDYQEIKERGSIRLITRYNSNSYFLHRGMDRGFEYEFFSEFAKKHDLNVDVVLLRSDDDPIDLLNRGEGDIIAGNYAVTSDRRPFVAFSRPYNLVNQVLVQRDTRDPITSITQLEGITISVRRNSSYYSTLRKLQEDGYDISIDIVEEDWNTEAIILDVSEGNREATIADDNLYQVAANYIDGVQSGLVLAESDTVAWAIRRNAPELKEKMDEFLTEYFRIRESDGRILRSAFLNILQRRYFEDDRQINQFQKREYDMVFSGYISPYDDIVKSITMDSGVDWKLVLAVMAQESEFDPNAQSWAGAIGLMQIIPRFSQVEDPDLLYDPEINIREGVRYLDNHLSRYAHLDSINRYSLALATYNIGIGHIADARILAEQLGNNPNEWENIADALLKLMHQKYYQHARYGFKRGIETVNYVQDIMERYRRFNTVAELAAHFETLQSDLQMESERIE